MTPPEELAGVDSVVISTDDGKPIAVALMLEGAIWIKTVDDPQFHELMEMLGFNKRDLPEVDVLNVSGQ